MDTNVDTEQRRPGLSLIPAFREPPGRRLDPPATGVPGDQAQPEETDTDPSGPSTLKPGRDATPTRISDSTGDKAPKPTAADTARLVAGLLGLVVAGAAMVVRWRAGRELRRPTKGQLDDISAPLARIGMRHVPAGLLNADLADSLAAGAALGAYVSAGPLIEHVGVDAGVPQGLNAPDEEYS